jgi:adenylyltransferase/sulfurtransferase
MSAQSTKILTFAGQLRLKSASVLLIGAGGLGCPAAVYIAGAGVGKIGLVDGDTVEVSNLHRQIAHSTETVGMRKVDSAIRYLKSSVSVALHCIPMLNNMSRINPNPIYVAHPEHISPQNAQEIVGKYDIVLDCTDNPASRYLISDICVLLSKTLVSASALRTDGQLIVLNSPPLPSGNVAGGPCYRCIFPKPPPADSVLSCGEGGILGPVVGVMGVLQAVEAIKIITQGKLVPPDPPVNETSPTSMLLFSALSTEPFRSVRLRARKPKCFACSKEATLDLKSLKSGSLDYALFCGLASGVNILLPEERIEARDYAQIVQKGGKHLLLDVREKVQFDICHLEGSINVPFSSFQNTTRAEGDSETSARPIWLPETLPPEAPIYLVCRLGNDSQVVTRQLKDRGIDLEGTRWIGDIKGGLKAWKAQVDEHWPEY